MRTCRSMSIKTNTLDRKGTLWCKQHQTNNKNFLYVKSFINYGPSAWMSSFCRQMIVGCVFSCLVFSARGNFFPHTQNSLNRRRRRIQQSASLHFCSITKTKNKHSTTTESARSRKMKCPWRSSCSRWKTSV